MMYYYFGTFGASPCDFYLPLLTYTFIFISSFQDFLDVMVPFASIRMDKQMF